MFNKFRNLPFLVILMVGLAVLAVPLALAQDDTPQPQIDLEKLISVDGGLTWLNADEPLAASLPAGAEVMYRLMVTNSGNVPLDTLTLSDDTHDTASCILPETLAAGAFFDCTLGPVAVGDEQGQQSSTAQVTGTHQGVTVSDADSVTFIVGDQPSLAVTLLISVDGGATWVETGAHGPAVPLGESVLVKVVITNDGNVALTDLALGDSSLDLSDCVLPATLEPGESVECGVEPVLSEEGQHDWSVTVLAMVQGSAVAGAGTGGYFGGVRDLPVVIVIEGPVQTINVNVINIYGFDIELAPDDPLLTVIQIGDVLRVEGSVLDGGSPTIIIIAINITIINVEVYILDGEIWRDPGNCANAPPPWAEAHGWHRRCDGHPGGQDSGGGSGSHS